MTEASLSRTHQANITVAFWEFQSQNATMIPRSLESKIVRALKATPVVAILGPRQAGKTTLALEIANDKLDKEVAWLDLERDSDPCETRRTGRLPQAL